MEILEFLQKPERRQTQLDVVCDRRSTVNLADAAASNQLREALKSAAQAQRSGASFHKQDLIEAVAMFFNTLLDPKLTSTPVRALLVHLELPVLRAVLLNERFFTDTKHPARRLIKALYVKAEVLGEQNLYEYDNRYQQMLNSVRAVAAEFSGDERLFLKAYFEINQLQV